MSLLGHLIGLFALAQAAVQPAQESVTAIVGADVLPMTGAEERLADRTVILRGDRIESIGPRASTPVPTGARRIDGRGMTLMPGLVDMHVHLAPAPGEPGDAAHRALSVMLAHGTTTARAMAGSPGNLAVRERIERGVLPGPRLYAAAPMMHGQNTPTPEAARAAVAAAATAGYDLIKSHHLEDPAVWQAVQDEARARTLPTAGHVTNPVGLDRAMAAGQQIEHLDGVFLALLPEGAPERRIDFSQIPPPEVVLAAARASDADLVALARRAKAAGSWHVPTLSLFERIADTATPTESLRALPEMRYVPRQSLDQWAQQRTGLADYPPEALAAFTTLRRRVVRAFHEAGVPMMAGSDTAQAFHLWGPGLIAEVEALADAGLPPMDALRSATIVPRDYFRSLPNGGSSQGHPADFGTIEPGARADLLLLPRDPSRDLTALRRPSWVIAAGRPYDRAALDHLLEDAAAAVARLN